MIIAKELDLFLRLPCTVRYEVKTLPKSPWDAGFYEKKPAFAATGGKPEDVGDGMPVFAGKDGACVRLLGKPPERNAPLIV